ncbi:hypothetical protein AAG570_010701 [Ranatra chinensis]|uniref:Uncharacterized protein n=1 Tax=Ranatra chinensis TaxID=642074 RepID=A0ABD0ZBN7_9HEMI
MEPSTSRPTASVPVLSRVAVRGFLFSTPFVTGDETWVSLYTQYAVQWNSTPNAVKSTRKFIWDRKYGKRVETSSVFYIAVDLRHVDEVKDSNIVKIGVDLSEYYKSVEWDILEVPAVRTSIDAWKPSSALRDCG